MLFATDTPMQLSAAERRRRSIRCRLQALQIVWRFRADVYKRQAEYGLICVDLQKAFDDFLEFRHSSFLAWDRVHPSPAGCFLMGTEFLRQTGFDFTRLNGAGKK